MSVFKKYNKGNNFDFEVPESFEYQKLEDVYDGSAKGKKAGNNIHKLNALFINTKSKFGEAPVCATDEALLNLPMHLTDDVKEMMVDEEVIDCVNSGNAYVEIYEYNSKKWGKNYSVNFLDETPF